MSSPIDEFVENVNKILAVDYGDFKRKAGDYLNRLEDQMPSQKQKFIEIRQYLIYNPTFTIEEAREVLIHDVDQMRS